MHAAAKLHCYINEELRVSIHITQFPILFYILLLISIRCIHSILYYSRVIIFDYNGISK